MILFINVKVKKKECPLQTIDNGKQSYTVLSYVLVYEDVLA